MSVATTSVKPGDTGVSVASRVEGQSPQSPVSPAPAEVFATELEDTELVESE